MKETIKTETTNAAEIAAFLPAAIGKLIRVTDEPKKANAVAYRRPSRKELFSLVAIGEVSESVSAYTVTRDGKSQTFAHDEVELLSVKGAALDLLMLGQDCCDAAFESGRHF